jgi:Zn finger protein HypA/HybF involved in hydrogenase expression
MSKEPTKEDLDRLFKEPEYVPTRFECRQCETVVRFGEVYCPTCDKILTWCEGRIKENDNKRSYRIRI